MSIEERTQKAHALLAILATVPMFVFDIFEYKAFGEFRLDPNLVQQLLAKRRQLDETKSIQENIAEHYGKRAAELAEELI